MNQLVHPIIAEPVFEGQTRLLVRSLESGCTISVASGEELLSQIQAPIPAVVLRTNRPLKAGEKIAATATKDSMGACSVPVEVRPLPIPLPTPTYTAGPTRYVDTQCIGASGSVPDALVSAWNDSESLGGEPAGWDGEVLIRLNRPIKGNDSIVLKAEMLGNTSGNTPAIIPVQPIGEPPYAEKLPAPIVQEPIFECQNAAGLTCLLIGARFEIYRNGTTVCGPACATSAGGGYVLGVNLQAGDAVTARQRIPTRKYMDSDSSAPVIVKALGAPPSPALRVPLYEHQSFVYVDDLLATTKVEIAILPAGADPAIGDWASITGDFDGRPEFGVPELQAGQIVKARQALCGRWGPWSNQPMVQAVAGPVDPPKLAEPLYPCANYVRVANALPGALVRVYADGVFVGQGSARLIRVVPHLASKQKITATQTIGDVTSDPSQPPVVVKDPPERVPAPTITGMLPGGSLPGQVVSFAPELRIGGLLPGACVSAYSKNFVVGTAEATDTEMVLPLGFLPWPGTGIYVRQSVCGHPSQDSNELTAVGLLDIVPPAGGNPPQLVSSGPVTMDLSVVTGRLSFKMYPAFKNTTVSLASSDPGVVKVLGSGTSVIAAGQSTTSFQVQILCPGKATLTANADHYLPAAIDLQGRGEIWFEDNAGKTQGRVLQITVDDSLDLKVFAKPVPPGGKIQLHANHGLVSIPSEITIPSGQAFGVAKVKALSVGQEEVVAKNNWYGSGPSFGEPKVTFTVSPKPVSPSTIPVPLLHWKSNPSGVMYVESDPIYASPTSRVLFVANKNTWGHRCNLLFANGKILADGAKLTPAELGLSDAMAGLVISATPSALDGQLGQWDVWVELTYTP